MDQPNRALIKAAVVRLRDGGSTVLVATHHVEQAYRLSARVVRLEHGGIPPPAVENLIEGEIAEQDGAEMLRVSAPALD